MKHIKNKSRASISLAILFFLGLTGVNAQDEAQFKRVELGFRFMPTFTKLDVRTSTGGTITGSAKVGFGAGAFLGVNLSKNVSLIGECIYSAISQKTSDLNVNRNIKLRYINVPILLSINTGKMNLVNLNAVAGPQIGFNIRNSIDISGANEINNSQPVLSIKKNDFGFAYGAGIDFGINPSRTARLGFGYRGVRGLIDINDNSNTYTTDSYYVLDRTKIKTNSAYVSLSIMF
jgi:opacity protein-like surface antigen